MRFTSLLILVLCFGRFVAFAQEGGSNLFPADFPDATNLFPNYFSAIDAVRKDSNQPKSVFALEFGPKLLELRASYFERRHEASTFFGKSDDQTEPTWGKYADVLATSSQFDGRLVGEAEAAYSTLGFLTSSDERPLMTRLALRGRWGKSGYGLSYRSSGRGFVSTNGAKIEHARDESQIWAEYDFNLFRLRGAVGEMSEENSETHHLALTRTAVASFQLNKPSWSATLSSSYSTIDNPQDLGEKTLALTSGLSLCYRLAPLLTLEPNFSFKQEWAPITRLKTDTPSASFSLAYAPSRDLRLIGRASYARDLSQDPLRTGSNLNAATSLNWKLRESFLGEQSVSLQLEYKNESRPTLPESQQSNLTAMVQFKILGF